MIDALPRKTSAQRLRAGHILADLKARYPDAHCELNWNAPHELLIATILSAQCTDVSVNRATPALFAAFPTPHAFARATALEIEPYVRSIGLFRNKAKAIHASCCLLVEQFGGEVPRTMDELLLLRGVARKTANVVLSNCFDSHVGVVVDTHVDRLAHRFALTNATTPMAIERDLMALFPQPEWGLLSHLLIFHGRRACKARGGDCAHDAICQKYCSQARSKAKTPTAPKALSTAKKSRAPIVKKVARKSAPRR